jgi:asparagine synthetase A
LQIREEQTIQYYMTYHHEDVEAYIENSSSGVQVNEEDLIEELTVTLEKDREERVLLAWLNPQNTISY